MRDIMFEIPSNPKIEKCIVTKETVQDGKEPKLILKHSYFFPFYIYIYHILSQNSIKIKSLRLYFYAVSVFFCITFLFFTWKP